MRRRAQGFGVCVGTPVRGTLDENPEIIYAVGSGGLLIERKSRVSFFAEMHICETGNGIVKKVRGDRDVERADEWHERVEGECKAADDKCRLSL